LKFDDNRITIRERSYIDLLDLALRVIRVYAWPLAVALLVGVAPMICLNAWLLADYAEVDFELGFPATYCWYMLQLVIWEMPLATAPITLYLGQALFMQRPSARRMVAGFSASLPQLLIYQVLCRGTLIPVAWIFTFSIYSRPLQTLVHVGIFAWFALFAVWPYLSEVILLERNPMQRHGTQRMTTFRRTRALHRGSLGDLFPRWLGALVIGGLLFVCFWFSIWLMGGMLLSEWEWEGHPLTLYYPLALWLVVGYFAVVRFLCYLDLRIRREGWEVELLMRAEGARLARQLT